MFFLSPEMRSMFSVQELTLVLTNFNIRCTVACYWIGKELPRNEQIFTHSNRFLVHEQKLKQTKTFICTLAYNDPFHISLFKQI